MSIIDSAFYCYSAYESLQPNLLYVPPLTIKSMSNMKTFVSIWIKYLNHIFLLILFYLTSILAVKHLTFYYIDGLVQDSSISLASALAILQSCSHWYHKVAYFVSVRNLWSHKSATAYILKNYQSWATGLQWQDFHSFKAIQTITLPSSVQ